jgi:hypothetical protein
VKSEKLGGIVPVQALLYNASDDPDCLKSRFIKLLDESEILKAVALTIFPDDLMASKRLASPSSDLPGLE